MPKEFRPIGGTPRAEQSVEERRRQFAASVELRVRNAVRPALQPHADAHLLSDSMTVVYNTTMENIGLIERNAELQRSKGAQIPQIACAKGCDYCCYVRVRVSIPEVLHIADHVRAHFSEADRQALLERLDAYHAEYWALPVQERLLKMIACPLLVDHLCSVHTARPIVCRAHHSIDLQACVRAFEQPDKVQIPHFLEVDTVVSPIVDGVKSAVRSRSLKGLGIQLPLALRVSLRDVDAKSKWLSGADVFKEAVDEELYQLATKTLRGQ